MSRSVPWRNKPTQLITQMIPVANQLKLYLVNQIGPTSFLFKDQADNKFKVIIGSVISCSCGVISKDHCIHTLYVLLKKYRVPQNHPILWQASYIDSQLQGLIQLKYMTKKKVQTKKYVSKRKANNQKQQENDFPPLNQEDACPICYEQFNNQCYSVCGTCRKPIHTKCLKIWVLHKQGQGSNVGCPMCRSIFPNPMLMIYQDLQKWEQRYSTHKGTLCKTCGVKNIKGFIFKCLLCPNTDLCKLCFEGNQHLQHQKFFVKQMATDPWKIAPLRIKKSKKQLFQPVKQMITQQLPQIQSQSFIINLFPTLKEHDLHQGSHQLGIIGNDILAKQLCYKCRTLGNQYMRKLNCGHSVHQECLKQIIRNKDFICQVDQEIICPGYISAMGIKIVRNKNSNKKMVDVLIMKNEQQKNKINDKLSMDIIGKKSNFRNMSMDNRNTTKQAIKKAASKDKNFRIMKKHAIQKRQYDMISIGFQNSPMMIMGLGHGNQQQFQNNQVHSSIQPIIPRPRGNLFHTNF